MKNQENYGYTPDKGGVLVETTGKTSKAKTSWGVRLDEETIQELDKIAETIGVNGDKRAVLEHLLKVRKTAELKGQVQGKIDTIEHVERALDLIRDEMNTLLRHNINKEEEIRDVISSEMADLEQKIKSLQDKLNNQLEVAKELKEESKSLKATLVDRDKEIKELNERYADTNKLIARLEKDEAQNQEKLAEFEELKIVYKELQATSTSTERELAKARAEVTTINAELATAKQSISDKDREIKSLTEANMRDINNLKEKHVLEIGTAVLEKEKEIRDKIDVLRDEKETLVKEILTTKEYLEKEKTDFKSTIEDLKSAHSKTVSELKTEHEAEIVKLQKQIKALQKKSIPKTEAPTENEKTASKPEKGMPRKPKEEVIEEAVEEIKSN